MFKNSMFEKLEGASTPAEMRAAIEKGRHHHPLIRNALDAARYASMSAEDTYAVLAYYAIQVLVEYQQQCLELASLSPHPFLMADNKDGKLG
jgi:hypothetical protein